MNFDYDCHEVCSQGSNEQYSSTGLDNGLAPARRQAIIWTNDGLFTDAYMRHNYFTQILHILPLQLLSVSYLEYNAALLI